MSILNTLNLVWSSKKPSPDQTRESTVFRYGNALWSLTLYYRKGECLIRPVCKTGEQGGEEEFEADVYFENPHTKHFLFALSIRNNAKYVNPFFDACGRFKLLCISKTRSSFEYCENGSIYSQFYAKRKRSNESHSDVCLPFCLDDLSGDLSKLLDQKILPDIQLTVGDQTFQAHRAILAARSEVFAATFKHEMAESKSGVVDLEGLEPAVFDVFIKYIYTGRISEESMREDVISKLYVACDKYAVSSLKMICLEFMMNHITDENCLSYLTFADRLHDDDLKKAVVSFLIRDEALLKSDKFKAFAKEQSLLAIEIYAENLEKKIQ